MNPVRPFVPHSSPFVPDEPKSYSSIRPMRIRKDVYARTKRIADQGPIRPNPELVPTDQPGLCALIRMGYALRTSREGGLYELSGSRSVGTMRAGKVRPPGRAFFYPRVDAPASSAASPASACLPPARDDAREDLLTLGQVEAANGQLRADVSPECHQPGGQIRG